MAERYGTHEQATLLALVGKKELPNTTLRNDYGINLTPSGRGKLNKAGLLVTRKENNRLVHEITPAGVEWCESALEHIETPPRAGALARVIFEWLRGIVKYLRKNEIRLTDVFEPDDLESLIRVAYTELSDEPQDWVRLAKLRPKLNGAEKGEVDKVLLAMTRTGLVHLAQSANSKALTDADHAAAIRIGSEDKHLVAIEES